jgi:hypothetical protein
MSQQSQKGKDADAAVKNDDAYGNDQKEIDPADFNKLDASYHETQEDLDRETIAAQPYDTIVTQPVVGQTVRNDNPPVKQADSSYADGVVDAPGANPTSNQADALRDATPNRNHAPVDEGQSCDV